MVALRSATPVMIEYSTPFALPSVARKKVERGVRRRHVIVEWRGASSARCGAAAGLAARLAGCMKERRNAENILHAGGGDVAARIFTIAAGIRTPTTATHSPRSDIQDDNGPGSERGEPLISGRPCAAREARSRIESRI